MMNTVTISTTLAIAITCMIIGFVTGGFIGYTNKDKKKNRQAEADQPSAPVPPSPPPLADPDKFSELLRLWRSKENKGLYVETSGHLLASSSPLNPGQKSRFIDLITELAAWLDVSIKEIVPGGAEVVPAVPQTPAQSNGPEVPPVLRKASEPVQTNPIPAPVITPAAISAVPQPVPVPTPAVQSTVTPPPPPVPTTANNAASRPPEPVKKKATSMVEQIDEVLQELIQQSDNPNRLIKLVEEQHEGVIVWVGQEHFIGIDAVTDQTAKDLIRSAVKLWDKRTETH